MSIKTLAELVDMCSSERPTPVETQRAAVPSAILSDKASLAQARFAGEPMLTGPRPVRPAIGKGSIDRCRCQGRGSTRREGPPVFTTADETALLPLKSHLRDG